VHQKAPDELERLERHRPPAIRAVNAIILPPERHTIIVGCNEALVRDGDAVCISGEIAQDLLGPCDRCAAVDDPADVA